MADEGTPGSGHSTKRSTEGKRASDELAADFHAATGLADSGGLPVIEWRAGELPRVVDQAEAALMQCQHGVLFQRGPFIVRVLQRQSMSVRSFTRPVAGLGICAVDNAYLVEQLTRSAVWEKYDSRSESMRRINAPELVAKTYLARAGEWRLPKLRAAICAPTLRPDGTVLQDAGYDRATATWYDPCGVDFPKIPEKPNRRQAAAAIDRLITAVDSIPFVDHCDRSVAASLMLTSLVRQSLPSAPLGAITAPAAGSGKTLLAECIAILATGMAAAAMQYPGSDEEAEKVALSVLMDGKPVVMIDNVEHRPLQGAWLCSMLTSETYEGRMLGRNEMISVPTTTLFLATGNKLVIQGDLRRRALLCRIDPRSERPEEREFKSDLRDEFLKARTQLVVAGLTLMRAYIHGGERASIFRPFGGFERWSEFCREPLMWLGLPDPCDSYDLIAAEDPERQEHLQMISAWSEAFKAEQVTASEAIAHAQSAPLEPLHEAILSVARDRKSGDLSAHRLSAWLRNRAGRIVDRAFFERGLDTHAKISTWKVTKLS